jgi:hypothetical protein
MQRNQLTNIQSTKNRWAARGVLKPVIDSVMGDPKIVPADFPFFPPHPLRGNNGQKLDVRAMHQTLAIQLMDHLDLEALAAWPN